MASKRQIRRRACSGKQRYVDAQTAFGVVRAMNRRKGYQGHMNTYRCPFCKGYHVGYAKKQPAIRS